jgi:hypothetical protein
MPGVGIGGRTVTAHRFQASIIEQSKGREMKRLMTILLLTAASGIGCSEEDLLFLSDLTAEPPDTTYDEVVELSGSVVRVPPKDDAILVVTVTGGVITAVDTANLHDLFTVSIPLNTNQENFLVATATDNLGATMTSPRTWTVVQIDTTTPLANDTGAR